MLKVFYFIIYREYNARNPAKSISVVVRGELVVKTVLWSLESEIEHFGPGLLLKKPCIFISETEV